MADDIQQKINQLVSECESALKEYADKTGANMFPEIVNQGLHLKLPAATLSSQEMDKLADDLQQKTETRRLKPLPWIPS